jgi:hypothetical protein
MEASVIRPCATKPVTLPQLGAVITPRDKKKVQRFDRVAREALVG